MAVLLLVFAFPIVRIFTVFYLSSIIQLLNAGCSVMAGWYAFSLWAALVSFRFGLLLFRSQASLIYVGNVVLRAVAVVLFYYAGIHCTA